MDQRERKSSEFERAFFKRVHDLAIAAFGLVAALAWNEAISGIVKSYIPTGSTILAQILYAIVVTLLAVIVTLWIGRVSARLQLDQENKPNGKKRS